MTYLKYKTLIIKKLEGLGCNLLRDGADIDFGLIIKSNQNEIYRFMINEGFVCTGRDSSKMNFKKFFKHNLLDIDIDIELNTNYLTQFFYDIRIRKECEDNYFREPEKYQIAMKTIRYIMLLRGKEQKYRKYFYENKKIIISNNFFIDNLTKTPFRKKINFESLMKIVSLDKIEILKKLQYKYIWHFFVLKIKYKFFKKRGIIVALDGVDGAGKTTIINMLTQKLGKPSIYMGERGFRYEKFYRSKKHFSLKPISLFGQYLEKIYRVIKARKLANRQGIIFCDRYHQYSATAAINRYIDRFNKIFFYFYPKPDIYIVLWNNADIILERKQEVTKEYIEAFNKSKEDVYKNAIFIKNDDIDDTLNLILKVIYA